MRTGVTVELRGAHMRPLVAVRSHGIMMMVMVAAITIVIVGTLGIFRIVDVLVIAPMEVVTIIFRIEGEESSVAAIQRQTLAFQQLPHLFLLPRFHIVANVRAAAT